MQWNYRIAKFKTGKEGDSRQDKPKYIYKLIEAYYNDPKDPNKISSWAEAPEFEADNLKDLVGDIETRHRALSLPVISMKERVKKDTSKDLSPLYETHI